MERVRTTHGTGSIVLTDYPVPELQQDLFQGTPGTYAGLDRFGRTVDHQWVNYSSGTVDVARYLYGYDANSNRLWKQDPVAAAQSADLDDLFTYDGLNRLTTADRGDLNGTQTALTTKTFGQSFDLDQLNNWSGFAQDDDGDAMDDLVQTRDHNAANEIDEIDSSSSYVASDAAGNMTKVPKPTNWAGNYALTWDAWDRLVKVADGANTVAEYAYDGMSSRIVKKLYAAGSFDHDEHIYLSEANQVLEVRIDSSADATKQYTWGTRYIDDLLVRTRDTNADTSLDETIYPLQDANWNVTALADETGAIQQRFAYDPYGRSTVLADDFTPTTDSYAWEYRFTSREFDSETGLHYFRARYYHDGLGRFLARDPLGYVDGASLYAGYFVPGGVDSLGLEFVIKWQGPIRSDDIYTITALRDQAEQKFRDLLDKMIKDGGVAGTIAEDIKNGERKYEVIFSDEHPHAKGGATKTAAGKIWLDPRFSDTGYLDQETIRKMDKEYPASSNPDHCAATVLAHEWGHIHGLLDPKEGLPFELIVALENMVRAQYEIPPRTTYHGNPTAWGDKTLAEIRREDIPKDPVRLRNAYDTVLKILNSGK